MDNKLKKKAACFRKLLNHSLKNYQLSIANYQLIFIFAPTFDQPLAKTVNVAQILNHNSYKNGKFSRFRK